MKLQEILIEEKTKEIQSLINSSKGKMPGGTVQLFALNPKNKNERELKKQANPDKGENKPNDFICWTSTAEPVGKKFTSAWVEWCKAEQPNWIGKNGSLYGISLDIISLELNNDRDVLNVWNAYCEPDKKFDIKTYRKDIQNYIKLVRDFPWDKIAKDFDCVYCKERPSLDNHFMYGWDIESSVFFKSDKLKFLKNVEIA